jgi:hypothetical protein
MGNLIEEIEDLKKRVFLIESMLGISDVNVNKISKTKKPKPEQIEEETINGFTKSQLRVMFNWAKNTKLQQLSKNDFEELKKWRMLKDFYPNAPDRYEDIIL